MNKKNILNITVRSDIGGGPIHLNELINNLDLNYINIFLACPFTGSVYKESWKDNNRISEVQEIPFRKFSIQTLFYLIKFVKKNNIQYVHSHGKGAGIYSRLIKLFVSKIKVIHTFHGVNIIEKGLKNNFKNRYLERILKKFTSIFICVSKGEKELVTSFLKIKAEKIKVIYNGVKNKNEEIVFNSQKAVVSFSRFSHEKNMFASYKIVKKSRSDIIFNWIGDGKDFLSIKKRKQNDKLNNLNLIGLKNNPQEYLVPGSIYLSTARHEGLPLSLLEAEAYGIPIIATNVVGNNEVVIDGYNGFLFDEDDLDDAVKKIDFLFKNPDVYQEFSKNAYSDYLKRFTVDKMIKETQKLYNEEFN